MPIPPGERWFALPSGARAISPARVDRKDLHVRANRGVDRRAHLGVVVRPFNDRLLVKKTSDFCSGIGAAS
jgi:hypothetical protein